MYKAFGIVNSSKKNMHVNGLDEYRPIAAFSFLGRYRVIDFPISNLSNSEIERIQVYTGSKPQSLVEHIGTGRHYNINSKSGKIQMVFSELDSNNNYNTDISSYLRNLSTIERMHQEYVVIVPSYMVYSADFSKLLKEHVDSGADITLLYHNVDNANEQFLNCSYLTLNKQKGVNGIHTNRGTAQSRSIFMDTYIMSKDLFVSLIQKASKLSSMYTLSDIVNLSYEDLDIRGISHHGYFAALTDFNSYYNANMSLLDYKTASNLFQNDWPIYTRTNDSAPTHYYENSEVKKAFIANGCQIEGTVINSIVDRGCVIKKGAVVKNSILLAHCVIGEDAVIENQVIDKNAQVIHVKEVISAPEHPGYIKKQDTL